MKVAGKLSGLGLLGFGARVSGDRLLLLVRAF